jgi:hypothetical protein
VIGYVTDFAHQRRMHSKSYTADSATIVGGRNIGDEYCRLRWRAVRRPRCGGHRLGGEWQRNSTVTGTALRLPGSQPARRGQAVDKVYAGCTPM